MPEVVRCRDCAGDGVLPWYLSEYGTLEVTQVDDTFACGYQKGLAKRKPLFTNTKPTDALIDLRIWIQGGPMTEEQKMDKNREFHELLEHEWNYREGLYNNFNKNPNYAADPRLVLREMDKQPAKIRHLFYAKLIYNGNNVEAIDDDGLIPRHYMTDQTGKLRDKAIEWMKGKE